MSENNVTIREFELLVKHQTQINKSQGEELAKIASSINQTNDKIQEAITLFREEVSNTKSLVDNHIYTYNEDKRRNRETFIRMDSRMKSIEETLIEREGLYKSAQIVRWVFVIVATGALTAFGASLGGYIHFGSPEVKAPPPAVITEKH